LNFNLYIFLILLSSCGVKGDPSAPKGSSLPSVLENYPDIKTQQPLDDSKIKK
jgi:hypothetical protein